MNDVLNQNEAAKLLRVTPRTLQNWIKRGETIPHRRVGQRKWYFDRAALIEWVRGKEKR